MWDIYRNHFQQHKIILSQINCVSLLCGRKMDSFVRTTETTRSSNNSRGSGSGSGSGSGNARQSPNWIWVLGYVYFCQRHKRTFLAVFGVSLLGLVLYSNSSSLEFWYDSSISQQLVRKDKDGILRFPCPSQDYALNVTNVGGGGGDFDGINIVLSNRHTRWCPNYIHMKTNITKNVAQIRINK